MVFYFYFLIFYSVEYKHETGRAVLHLGRHRHGANDIRSGLYIYICYIYIYYIHIYIIETVAASAAAEGRIYIYIYIYIKNN